MTSHHKPKAPNDAAISSSHEAAESEVEQGCPTPTAHARLREAHQHWHDALAGYQDPEGFRVALNACIQALRSVSFVLEKEGDTLPDFEGWYEPWRDRLKADPVMRWLVKARNRIVHAGDLETRSRATARFIFNYQSAAAEMMDSLVRVDRPPDAAWEQEVEPPAAGAEGEVQAEAEASSPLLTLSEILQEFGQNEAIPKAVKLHASLSIERSWVVDDLPEVELLDALAHGYGELSLLIEDAHHLVGWETGTAVERSGEHHVLDPNPLLSGRLPCMVTTRSQRTIVIGPTGRSAAGMLFDARPLSQEDARKAENQYKSPRVRLEKLPMNAIDHLPICLSHALAILKTGEEHGWFVLYFKGRRQVHTQTLAARDRADKRMLAQEVAELVALNGIDGIVEIGETWMSDVQTDDDGVPISPTDRPDRAEALMLHAELATGESKCIIVPFRRRRFGRPVISEPYVTEAENLFLAPVRAVWKVTAPSPEEAVDANSDRIMDQMD